MGEYAKGDPGARRRPRILVLSPAGIVYDHDKVRARPEAQEVLEGQYFNIGDMVVYDSTLKLLDYETVEGMEISNLSDPLIEHYKTFDLVIVRASNFIHNHMNWHRVFEVLERTQLPIYAVGVGGQSAVSNQTYKLTGQNLRLWQMVSERSRVVGVRGAFTAELLNENGIKNVEVVGCPSLFRKRDRDLRIVPKERVEHVAFSIRREVDAAYAADAISYLNIQRDFLLNTMNQFDTMLTTHGEIEEKSFFFKNAKNMAAAEAMFLRSGWWTPETAGEMRRLYENQFFFLRVEDYDAFITGQDFAIGYRVHGVLPALASGVPGILVRYDSRSAELADSLSLPSLQLSDEAPPDVAALLRETSFETFNSRFAANYDRMRVAFERNGLPHRM